jgi:hypothetical protein
MKSNIIILSILLLGFLSCHAQSTTIEWGQSIKADPELKFEKLIHRDGNAYFVLYQKLMGQDIFGVNAFLNPVLVKYDANLNPVNSIDFNKLYKAKCEVVNLEGKLYLISQARDMDNKQSIVLASAIDNESLAISPENKVIAQIPYESLSFPGEFSLVESLENSQIALVAQTEYEVADNFVELRVFEKDWDVIHQEKQAVKENSPMRFPAKGFIGRQAVVLQMQDKESNVQMAKMMKSPNGMESLELKNTITNKAIDYSLFEEDFSSDEQVYTNNEVRFGRIYVQKTNAEGNVLWAQEVGKNQKSNTSREMLSYASFETAKGIVLFFNEQASDGGMYNLCAVVIDKENGMVGDKKVLLENSAVVATAISKIEESGYLLYSKQDGEYKLGILKVE